MKIKQKGCNGCCFLIAAGIVTGGLLLILTATYGCRKNDMLVTSGCIKQDYIATDNGAYTEYYASVNLRFPDSESSSCNLNFDSFLYEDDANNDLETHPPGSEMRVYKTGHDCFTKCPVPGEVVIGYLMTIFSSIAILVVALVYFCTPFDRAGTLKEITPTWEANYEPWGWFKLPKYRLVGDSIVKKHEITLKFTLSSAMGAYSCNIVSVVMLLASISYDIYSYSLSPSGFVLAIILLLCLTLLMTLHAMKKHRFRKRPITIESLETIAVRFTLCNIIKIATWILSMVAASSGDMASYLWYSLCILVTVGGQIYLTAHVFITSILWLFNVSTCGCFIGRGQFDFYEMHRVYRNWLYSISNNEKATPLLEGDEEEDKKPTETTTALAASKELHVAMLQVLYMSTATEGCGIKLYREDPVLMALLEKRTSAYVL